MSISALMPHTPLRAWQRLLAHIPSRCMVCQNWPAQPLCHPCLTRFATHPYRCPRCALARPAASTGICQSCQDNPPPLSGCLAAVDYAYPWDRLIADFKFHDHTWLARPLADLCRQAAGVDELIEACDALVPMPLSDGRLRNRGYNQAELLAGALSAVKTRTTLLIRSRDTKPQADCSLAERQRNIQHAFACPPSALPTVAGHHLLLVDDVMTTGSSLHEAAATLLQAGASKVSAIVIARTPDPHPTPC